MIDQVVGRILDRCFPGIDELPSGSDVFASLGRDKNFDFLTKVSHRLDQQLVNEVDVSFSKMFVRQVRACVPVEHRSEFITWICTKYLADPRVYCYLYGTSRPLAETDRKLSNTDLKMLLPIRNALDE